jgi:nucleotide-binding universal stress UspA family protein
MFKDIAIHLTGSEADQRRIDYAATIARMFDAHLSGLQVHQMPEVLAITDPTGSAYLQDLILQSADHAAEVGTSLRTALAATALRHNLTRLDAYPGTAGDALADRTRLSEEAVLFKSGRPCIFRSPFQSAPPSLSRIYVAWKNTRESARALGDALPLLKRAQTVIVGIIEEQPTPTVAGVDVGRLLSRHGVHADIRTAPAQPDTGAAILDEAWKAEAGLIVMGAYGHSRFREWLLGGATRHVLSNSPIPVLVSH